MNLILDTDSYKASHFLQFPPGTTSMFSYFESRGGKYPGVIFFGLQYYLRRYLEGKVATLGDVEDAKQFFTRHGLPFNKDGWEHIAVDHKGHLPIRIRAVPEGMFIPNHNVMMTVESICPKDFWVVNWLETMLVRVWYPTTVATRSHYIRSMILGFLKDTSDNPEAEIDFKLHDFGSRGVSSQESAGIGGAAHLVNFKGSDTVAGVLMANEYYYSDMAAFSIPAAEHATITSWGNGNGEIRAYQNMLKQFAKPGALVAVVSDSYDIYNAVSEIWGRVLKDEVVKSGATVIIRPDSGDPPTVVLEVLKRLDTAFGHTMNGKGYKVLNHVRVIQGDGINEESLYRIMRVARDAGYSISNLAFGMGGGLLQQLDRDTQKFAFKCSSVTINDQITDVKKEPITDTVKKSKAGRLDLVMEDGELKTKVLRWGMEDFTNTVMRTVFESGELKVEQTLEEIRTRAKKG